MLERADLKLAHVAGKYVVERKGEGGAPLRLDAEEFRWLCLIAGPTLLAEHAPRPRPVDVRP